MKTIGQGLNSYNRALADAMLAKLAHPRHGRLFDGRRGNVILQSFDGEVVAYLSRQSSLPVVQLSPQWPARAEIPAITARADGVSTQAAQADADCLQRLREAGLFVHGYTCPASAPMGTKNYNRIFLSLTRNLRKDGFSSQASKKALLAQTGEASVWPDDVAFQEAWMHKPLYGTLNSPKLVHLYGRLNQTCMSSKSELLIFAQPPTVEHIMPRDWITNWPLPDGTKGLSRDELSSASPDDASAIATRKRHDTVHAVGNLTILSSALNSSQGNSGWADKRIAMKNHSLLPINQTLVELPTWGEGEILSRATFLFERARQVWGR